MKFVYDSDIHKTHYSVYMPATSPKFLCYLFCVLNRFVCLPPRSLKIENERIEVPVLSIIVQCEFEGLEHFNLVHGLLPFELRKKLLLWVV